MVQRVAIWETVVKESGQFQGARAGGEEASLAEPLMELRGGRRQQQQDPRDRLPVIVCPSHLEFYLDQRESHKQVLTLYNVNDFPLHFLLQSNAPRRYAVPDPEGLIRPRCFIDVVVRHREVSEANVGRPDQLRVVMREEGGVLRGIRDVPVILRASHKDAPSTVPPTAGDEAAGAGAAAPRQDGERRWGRAAARGGAGGGYQVALVAALACLVALVLPLDDASSPSGGNSSYSSQLQQPSGFLLRLSHQQKLVAAYVLGLVTMLLLRQ